MVYINVTQTNEFTLNINNNLRDWYGSSPTGPIDAVMVFRFKHILSDKTRISSCIMDQTTPVNPDFFGASNGRYCEFYMSASEAESYMSYDGEYLVTIHNDNQQLLYSGIWKVKGNSETEENPFIEYTSDNETNDNYIYIEE